ncbi:organic cation transporter protein-like isoform X1 [Plutella xylostella]|uniref:organic cation transporter protein-like isoform X1 n=2 Tax=Plutella xylostella TaxID=51655 RepID=UPI00203289EE|nr:organic cation transporter protein-like isoform X1 [Plutella xylostella]
MTSATIINNKIPKKLENLENFGKYQYLQYCLICLPLMFISMINVNYIFVAGEVDYRCKVPECENSTLISKYSAYDEKCMRPVFPSPNYTSCSNLTSVQFEVCEEWIYENNNSIISELNLACQPWKLSLVGSIHNGGMIVSMVLMGWISDKIGRKPCLILCSVTGIIGLMKLWITNYYAYLAVEFLESVLTSGLYTVAIVLLMEVGGRSKRVLAGVIFSYSTYVGEVAFAFIAIGLPYWKHLIVFINSPVILFISYQLILKESTRWQILRGHIREAKKTLVIIAKMNKIDITSEELNNISDNELRQILNIEVQTEKETFTDIITSKETMKRLAVTSFCYFTSGLVYYGLMVHSVFLPGNKYYNFALVAVASFPGDFLAYFTFNKYGRRISLQTGYIACAVFLLLQYYVQDTLVWLKIILFLSGKLVTALCYTGIFTYSLELFPTSARGSLVGCGNMSSRIGCMLSPLTTLLVQDMPMVPTILFAATSLLSGLLLMLTPETKTMPLMDTIAQINNFKKSCDK